MSWISLFTAVAWVDFAVIVLSKIFPLTKTLNEWYREFGMVAVGQDVLIIVLGISLAQILFPGMYGWNLVWTSVLIQIAHDILFYVGVIQTLPGGHNKVIDLFKRYAAEGSWKIIVADSAMVISSVLLMEYLDNSIPDAQIAWIGLLALYSLLYIIYTK